MKYSTHRFVVVAAFSLIGTAAFAQSTPWSVRVGPGAVRLHVDASPEAPPGTPVPGGGLSASNSNALLIELGYEVAPAWTARFTFGVPPTTKVTGTGTLAPLGKMGDIKYGPAVLSATYALGHFGPVSPYVGGGLSYLKVFSTTDAALSNFRVENAWGGALQLGADIALDRNFSLFVDVKKIFLDTKVRGTVPAFGGAPAYAKVAIDPFVLQIGVGYRF